MGRAKKVRKFAATKRVIGSRDARLKENQQKALSVIKAKTKKPVHKGDEVVREM